MTTPATTTTVASTTTTASPRHNSRTNEGVTPRHNSDATNEGMARNPFATPPVAPSTTTTTTTILPARPEAAAYADRHEPIRHYARSRPTLSPTHSQPDSAIFPTKPASMSSAGASSTTPVCSIDLEKAGSYEREEERARRQQQQEQRQQQQHLRHSSRDPEKAAHSPTRYSRHQYSTTREHRNSTTYLEDDEMEESKQLQEDHALKILLFLTGPCAILSFLNAMWTILSLFITLMTQPVRLCARRPSFCQQLGGLVGPALNLQLKAIYTPLPPHANEDTTYRSGMLVLVMLLSPVFSLGMALAAWVAAIYWVSSAVVGDPAGLDKRDDGRETVLALRSWWEKWLVRSIRGD